MTDSNRERSIARVHAYYDEVAHDSTRESAVEGVGAFFDSDMDVAKAYAKYQRKLRAAEEAKAYLRGVMMAAVETGEESPTSLSRMLKKSRPQIYDWIAPGYSTRTNRKGQGTRKGSARKTSK